MKSYCSIIQTVVYHKINIDRRKQFGRVGLQSVWMVWYLEFSKTCRGRCCGLAELFDPLDEL